MSLIERPSDKIHKYASHWSNNSGEIAVFEAARYFSSANEIQGTFQKFIEKQNKKYHHPTARMSLDDMPMRINPIYPALDQKQIIMNKENKKYKQQPSSPGNRLASFLNSLFNQNNSKKKKSKKGENSKDHDPKRRMSISHLRITSVNDSNTPTKSCRDFRSFLDEQKGKNGGNISLMKDEKFRVCNNGNNIIEKLEFSEERKLFRRFIDEDEDSDSSSDLFDLPSHELDFYSSGLPVYETTHMDRIRIGNAV